MPKKQTKVTELDELTNDLKRLQADFINFKQRADKDKQEALALGRELAIAELLPVFDNLERAFAHTPEELKDNAWVKGVNGLEKQLFSTLSSLGLTRIDTTGKPFDPNTMEAVSLEEGGDGQETVVQEMQTGYLLNGKVLRPAKVKVKS